jgi:EAL domain-containing protein (putative c-di-GMP-specific phosphodiesterase class I)
VLNKIKTIFDAPFRIAHQDLRVSASMGIAIYPDDGKTTLELLKNSETAMYQAKEQGKDQHAFFASVTNEEVRQRLQHEKELRKAIENETLSVLYQPTIDVAEEKVIEFEALVRWNKAPKELQHAETIAEFAKENNLPLDMYVIKQVLNQLQTWQEDGKPLYPISINLNNNTIEADDFYNDLAALKEQYGELFHYLTFEILITDNLHIIQEVAGLGVHITLDKFGKDSLFLQEMATFPVDTIKVDASLIQSIETNATAIKLLSAMVAMSNAFGVKISAVGVEALQEKELISTLGFDQYQGHYFSKAVSSEQIEEGLH